ncbi:hypothetical protein NS226_17405 [Aureimonas ureilytica]|uniref:Uncharacterized protein n=1 Tax=Aureimonas ureilytica TaxID=401562 RepID=A0A175R543_9HYPH|nr:hypothetical protein [Aureimonas ureilytica]KTQ88025.1 hypothetical protein NS226_17405 [Aureimonas ureilytica]
MMPHPDHDPKLGRELETLASHLEHNLKILSRLDSWNCRVIGNSVLREAIGFLPHDKELHAQPRGTLAREIPRVAAMVAITEAMVSHRRKVCLHRLLVLLRRIGNLPSLLRRP